MEVADYFNRESAASCMPEEGSPKKRICLSYCTTNLSDFSSEASSLQESQSSQKHHFNLNDPVYTVPSSAQTMLQEDNTQEIQTDTAESILNALLDCMTPKQGKEHMARRLTRNLRNSLRKLSETIAKDCPKISYDKIHKNIDTGWKSINSLQSVQKKSFCLSPCEIRFACLWTNGT